VEEGIQTKGELGAAKRRETDTDVQSEIREIKKVRTLRKGKACSWIGEWVSSLWGGLLESPGPLTHLTDENRGVETNEKKKRLNGREIELWENSSSFLDNVQNVGKDRGSEENRIQGRSTERYEKRISRREAGRFRSSDAQRNNSAAI